MEDQICEVIVTAEDPDWLIAFSRQLVADRLCACGQNIQTIRSIYRWKDDIQEATEARVALHTRTSLVPRIVERANQEHPYDVPCVIALPVIEANPDYTRWVVAETEGPGREPSGAR